MKNLLILCFVGLIIFCACEKEGEKKPTIAILTPVTHPSLEIAEKGFIQTIEKENPGKYNFITYNAQGNKTLMRSELEEIMRQNYALVLTLGTTASQMTAEIFAKKGIQIPVVFTCVNDPMGFRIVKSEQLPGGTVTGVKEMLDFPTELSLLKKFKPDLKNLLLVYNPAEPGLDKNRKEIENYLQDLNIKLTPVETFQTNEMLSKINPFMEEADAVLILKDNTVVSGLDVIVKLCNRYQIPLMASDLDSPDRGAALGYGVHEINFGIEAAKKALKILNENISPGDIPVTPVTAFTLRTNVQAMQQQGIK